jgi:hypothetical protein
MAGASRFAVQSTHTGHGLSPRHPLQDSTPPRLTAMAKAMLRVLPSALLLLLPATAWSATPFQRSLSLQAISFTIQATGEGSRQELTIRTEGTKLPVAPIRRTVEGRVVGAEVADLNGNGQPEIYIYVQGPGSDRHGELVAYALVDGTRLAPIAMEALSGNKARGMDGFRGHDSFQVQEGCLIHRFPVYKATDTNARASGGERQICYELASDAPAILRAAAVMTVSSP